MASRKCQLRMKKESAGGKLLYILAGCIDVSSRYIIGNMLAAPSFCDTMICEVGGFPAFPPQL
jgi:hypothetical protein